MINGRLNSKNRYGVSLKQKVSYDSNVIQEADKTLTKATEKSSQIYKTTLNGNYKWIPNKFLSFSPGLTFDYTKHSESNILEIKELDNHSLNSSIRGKI